MTYSSSANHLFWNIFSTQDTSYTNGCRWNFGYAPYLTQTDFAKWHHVFCAVDVGIASTTCTGNPYVDYAYSKIGCVVFDGIDWSDNTSRITTAPNSGSNSNERGDNGHTYAGFLGAQYDSPYPMSGWNIALNGCSIGVPFLRDSSFVASGIVPKGSYAPIIEMGDTQAWFGKFIDPRISANFAKFVNISGGKGTPVDPAIAAAAFGTPTLRFKGNHTQFTQNTGTGGDFTLIGTDSDFTPTPSYG